MSARRGGRLGTLMSSLNINVNILYNAQWPTFVMLSTRTRAP